MTSIYTKTGDQGETGLFGGGRVAKDDPRVEAYGEVDELNAALGVARSTGLDPQLEALAADIQAQLFTLGAVLATNVYMERVLTGAERRVVSLSHAASIDPQLLVYLNRLSDLLFVMARVANHRTGLPDVPWTPPT